MNPLKAAALRFSANARNKRIAIFHEHFHIDRTTKLLDFGSENGANITNYLAGSDFEPNNIYIADIDRDAVETGRERFGFTPVSMDEDKDLPFEDNFFDIVFCSSVIEHTTVGKSEIWELTSGSEFKERSWTRQRSVANEIARLGKQYFVQTPSRSFPIESHTWLPFVAYLPREQFIRVLKLTNRFWVKKSIPDFSLLDRGQMQDLFPDADILTEAKFGMEKSIMAIKADRTR